MGCEANVGCVLRGKTLLHAHKTPWRTSRVRGLRLEIRGLPAHLIGAFT
jgi:hypothetical protein